MLDVLIFVDLSVLCVMSCWFLRFLWFVCSLVLVVVIWCFVRLLSE